MFLGSCALINWPLCGFFCSLKSRKNIICRRSSGLLWQILMSEVTMGESVTEKLRLEEELKPQCEISMRFWSVCVLVWGWVREYVWADFQACMWKWGHCRAPGKFNLGFVLQNSPIYNRCTAGNCATGHAGCRWKIDWHTRLCKNTPRPQKIPSAPQPEPRHWHGVGGRGHRSQTWYRIAD